MIKCKFYERNCPWTGPLAKLEDHLAECEFGERICDDCKTSVENSKVSTFLWDSVAISWDGVGC